LIGHARVGWSCRSVPLTSRYASMNTDPNGLFTLLSLTALLMMIINTAGRRCSAQHRCNAFPQR
jgi:hypothetical protein